MFSIGKYVPVLKCMSELTYTAVNCFERPLSLSHSNVHGTYYILLQ